MVFLLIGFLLLIILLFFFLSFFSFLFLLITRLLNFSFEMNINLLFQILDNESHNCLRDHVHQITLDVHRFKLKLILKEIIIKQFHNQFKNFYFPHFFFLYFLRFFFFYKFLNYIVSIIDNSKF